ncbi:MAG: ABC transporter permease [Verrucomicrobiae bacterium]|jgi:ABC-2 type transport system permease protein|nr:ABC transporter permease [Verrucomicrobiae bacterium]
MNLAVRNIYTIAKREMGGYFTSPVAYVFIVIFLILAGVFTFPLSDFFARNEASLNAFFFWHCWLYLFLVPAVGMRLWSEERRLGTIELLLTMPVTGWQAIVGKFLASWLFLGLALALTFPMVITVNYLGNPDNGVIFCGYLGSFLMAGAYLAVSCLTSAITRSQVVSFILSVVLCLALVMAGWPPLNDMLSQWFSSGVINAVASISVMTHFSQFQRGIIDSGDIVFFLGLIFFCLFTTGVVIRSYRAG